MRATLNGRQVSMQRDVHEMIFQTKLMDISHDLCEMSRYNKQRHNANSEVLVSATCEMTTVGSEKYCKMINQGKVNGDEQRFTNRRCKASSSCNNKLYKITLSEIVELE